MACLELTGCLHVVRETITKTRWRRFQPLRRGTDPRTSKKLLLQPEWKASTTSVAVPSLNPRTDAPVPAVVILSVVLVEVLLLLLLLLLLLCLLLLVLLNHLRLRL